MGPVAPDKKPNNEDPTHTTGEDDRDLSILMRNQNGKHAAIDVAPASIAGNLRSLRYK